MERINVSIVTSFDASEIAGEFVNNKYYFEYDESTSINEFIRWLLKKEKNHNDGYLPNEYLKELFKFQIGDYPIRVNLKYGLKDFIEQNNLGENIIIWYSVGLPGGFGGEITTCIKLYLYGDEGSERNIPHVYAYKGKGRNHEDGIRIKLSDLTELKTKNQKSQDLFTNKEMKIIKRVISECRDKLEASFCIMQNGGDPEEIVLCLDSGCYYFK